MDLRGLIINLNCAPTNFDAEPAQRFAYKIGHRDARHAAAELALKADACIEVLRALDKRLRECSDIPASAADAYDTFWQAEVSGALAALEG